MQMLDNSSLRPQVEFEYVAMGQVRGLGGNFLKVSSKPNGELSQADQLPSAGAES